MKPIYLDYNATTPIASQVKHAMLPFLDEQFGNPSSIHWFGTQTKKAIETARSQVATMLGCAADEIFFTSGGSEANNLALKGYAIAHQSKGRHIITSQIEHPAVLKVCDYLQQNGFQISAIPVDEFGVVKIDELEKAIRSDTILISVMHANNEVGSIQPVEKISAIARNHGIVLHTDAAQSAGKIGVRVEDLGVDMLSIAGHKLYAPKGVGALYLRRGIEIEKQMHGADHEQNLRAGTENVLEIVGLGKACEIATQELEQTNKKLKERADQLWNGLLSQLDTIRLNGHPENRLPNTVSVSFNGLEANVVLDELDSIAASAGAACHADQVTVSYVLEAMNVPTEWAMGTIRFSVGKMTTSEEIDVAIDKICTTVQQLRGNKESIADESAGHIKLTHFTHGLGCACKLRPQALEELLAKLPKPDDSNILVGAESSDDAAVYKINENTAIVQSVDFFTPIVDDPFHFGAIAAANALSDIYAMGGKPLFGLNIVGFPSNRLPMSVLDQILQGAQKAAADAGISIIGGHTVDDTEPKFGLAVTGIIHPQKILKNIGAQVGEKLILTKPLGLGIIATAVKRGLAEKETADYAIQVMSALNRNAANVASKYPVHACTDITGFGLLGHLYEMTKGSRVDAKIYAEHTPFIKGAEKLAQAGAVPGGTKDNLEFLAGVVQFADSISPLQKLLLADAQTSGGLLIALPGDKADACLEKLKKECEFPVSIIGEITKKGSGTIKIV
jgi:cysteine desulfurase